MSRDLRKYARNTTTRLVSGFVVLLLIVGDGLIYLFYGPEAALSGFLCFLGGLVPILLIYGALSLLDVIAKKANEE